MLVYLDKIWSKTNIKWDLTLEIFFTWVVVNDSAINVIM